MPILHKNEFVDLKGLNRAIIAIDHGEKRIGVAKSDAGWMISNPYSVIKNTKFTLVADQIKDIISENEICGVVIGLPLTMLGAENRKCQSIKQFAKNLNKIVDIPICFQDERFTTIQAEETLSNYDVSRDKKNARVDKIAASHILQGFLDMF